MNKILVVNAGSSTIKWKLFIEKTLEVVAEGVAERLFVDGHITTIYRGEKWERFAHLDSHKKASREIFNDLNSMKIISDRSEIKKIGFRVVQGGSIFKKSTILGEKEIEGISELSKMAPLHNGAAVQAIRAIQQVFPDAVLSATFDTSFHSTIDEVNAVYPIKKEITDKLKIRKYGAHGTSHKFITNKLKSIINKKEVNLLSLHIGSGASLCAVKNSKSFDTSMGLTPLAGIMMGTRSGDIDPSIHEYVCKEMGITIQEFTKILNKESGLQGVAGTQDMRDVLANAAKGESDSSLALNMYIQKMVDYAAIYINKLEMKLDAIVFTAGVGENSSLIRKKVIDKIKIMNLKLDDELNESRIGDFQLISSDKSLVPIYVIRTDEELMIAQEAKTLDV